MEYAGSLSRASSSNERSGRIQHSPSTLPLGHELEAEWLRAMSPSTLLRTVSLSNGLSNAR
jgi:hypothetical protein